MMQVTRLFLHPVKSLGGFNVQQFAVDRFGPALDRRWLVVDRQGRFLTQRQHAAMALVKTALVQGQVSLSAPQEAEVHFSVDDFSDGESMSVYVWRDQCVALTGPAALDHWLSHYLGVECRLVFMPDSTQRKVDPHFAFQQETVSFADGFPLLLASDTSLQDLNARMSLTVGMERFRPNLVVDGAVAFEEDTWKRIRVGSMEFRVVKPCSRCAIPTIDPATAEKQPEVFKALKAYRARGNEVFFGQNLLPVDTGWVRLGDKVEVLE